MHTEILSNSSRQHRLLTQSSFISFYQHQYYLEPCQYCSHCTIYMVRGHGCSSDNQNMGMCHRFRAPAVFLQTANWASLVKVYKVGGCWGCRHGNKRCSKLNLLHKNKAHILRLLEHWLRLLDAWWQWGWRWKIPLLWTQRHSPPRSNH